MSITAWRHRGSQVSTGSHFSPIVEGALMRFLKRIGESAETALLLLRTFRNHPRMTFFPDSISYLDVHFAGTRGYRQHTDVYLAELAHRNGVLLATFGRGLQALRPGHTHLLVPAGECGPLRGEVQFRGVSRSSCVTCAGVSSRALVT